MTTSVTPLRILSVEDEMLNRALLEATLRRVTDGPLKDAHLTEATTLAEARACLTDGSFDLILLDRRLPDGDGLDLARELVDASMERPRIVALTADAVPATRAAADAAGCDALVTKPYNPAELAETLRAVLESR